MTHRQMFMAVALLASAALAIFGDRTPEGEDLSLPAKASAPEGAPPRAVRPPRHGVVTTERGPDILPLRERLAPPPMTPDAEPETKLFGAANWDPPPPKVVPAPPPPPMAPPLPYTYIGKKQEGGRWEVYLSQGDHVLIVQSNSTLDGIYKVGRISPPTLSLTYVPLNQVQTLNIGAAE